MGDDKEWQRQLLGAALMAAAKTAVDYVTNPESRDETASQVRSKLAEVDYNAAAKALSRAIDQLAEQSKTAVNEAIDSIRQGAEEAVEAAAERAEEQLGRKKRGRGRLFFGMLVGLALGFVLLNEDRRNQVMDMLTGASGNVDSGSWDNFSSTAQTSIPEPVTPAPEPVSNTSSPEPAVAPAPTPASEPETPPASKRAAKSDAAAKQDTEEIPTSGKAGSEKKSS